MYIATRRHFLSATAMAGAALPMLASAGRASEASNAFDFEIIRSDADWRALLGDEAFAILRDGETEWPNSSPLVTDYRTGGFACRGCDLPLYTSDYRVEVDKGYIFFRHAQPNSVLTGIDTVDRYGTSGSGTADLIEVHCRRCGSHLGHVLLVEDQVLHCVNGTSLVFTPST